MKDQSSYPLKAVPGYEARHPGVQVGIQLAPDAGADDMRFARQLGVEWVMTSLPAGSAAAPADYKAVCDRFAAEGLKVYRLANHACHNMDAVTLGLANRDDKIEEYLAYLRNLARVGVRYATYAHMANGIWSTETEPIRGGAKGRALRLRGTPVGDWVGTAYAGPLTHGRRYTEDELWAHFEYFIRKVVPVAEGEGIRIGMHPDDPPVYAMGGIPRCILGTWSGYRRALEIADSPNVGVCLCCGCWLEGGSAMGADLLAAIRGFGAQGKLFKVHLRNVTAPLPDGFVETFLDDGVMDMGQVVQALREAGFDGAMISDHGQDMVGGRHASEALAIGYMKGLLGRPGPE
jgi:mannonate dehydratase